MNFSGILGILAAIGMFLGAIMMSSSSADIYLNSHGIFVVLGGTLAATMLCFPIPTVLGLLKVVFQKIVGKFAHRNELVIQEIVALAKGNRENPNHLREATPRLKNPFLKEALELQLQGGMTSEEVDVILEMRAATHFVRYEEEANIFRTLSKFPPAFGLMGTTLGMITLLNGLGSPDAFKKIGPGMAIGLVATLYGLALANLVFIPIAENLTKLTKDDEVLRDLVMNGVKLIRQKKHPLVVEEYLKSYLLPKERAKVKKAA